MSDRCFFISDLHLDASRPYVTEAFCAFLEQRRDASALYILGDLFEFWVGDDDDAQLVTDVAHMLYDYQKSGPELFIMHGNRDFLLGERFMTRVGARLLPDPSIIEAQGQRMLLMHGDSLCTRDTEYQAFRALARDPDWQERILLQSLAERRELAQSIRKTSRDAGSRKAADIMDVTERDVIIAMQESHCDTLIHGHTHRPARHEDEAGTRWVLGDWDKTGWYLELSEGQPNLVEFDIKQ